jgi:hypothetical protein
MVANHLVRSLSSGTRQRKKSSKVDIINARVANTRASNELGNDAGNPPVAYFTCGHRERHREGETER